MTNRIRLALVLVWVPFLASLAHGAYVFWLNVGVSASSWVEMQAYSITQTLCLAGIGVGIGGSVLLHAFAAPSRADHQA